MPKVGLSAEEKAKKAESLYPQEYQNIAIVYI